MTNDKTARVLRSAARWLQRRARKKSGTDTKAAYREAIVLVNGLTTKKVKRDTPADRTTADRK
jgi:hypothetical protein